MDDTPSVVKHAMEQFADKLSKPPEPVMTRAEFDKLTNIRKSILTCNMPGCGDVVCTHGMLCVKHTNEH